MTGLFSTRRPRRALVAAIAALGCAVALSVAPPGPAQAIDFGGSTNLAPNTTFGCEAGPRLFNANGDYDLFASGTANCTWVQLPTFGGTPNGSPPVSGRVTAVRVRSGANPAPLRFTVVRFISGITADGQLIPNSTQCCFGERTTRTFAMRPNAITTIGLDLPVLNEKRFDERLVITDFVGFSANSFAGNLPVRLTVDRLPNSNDILVPGTPQVSMHYPEITPRQVRTDATTAPALLITAVFTMCTAGAGSGRTSPGRTSPGSTFKAGGACGARTKVGTLKVRNGKIKVPLKCVGLCAGKIKIVRAKGKGKLAKAKKFTVQPDKKGKISVKLTKAGKAATKGKRTVRAKVIIKSQGARTTKVITLK